MGRHPVRRLVIAAFSLITLLVVLVVADRVCKAIAENDVADQARRDGLGARPSIDITGFPFLTQLAERDFRRVDISARDVPAGPLEIAAIHATATGVHVNSSYNGAVVDRVTGSGLVTFAAIADAFTGAGGSGGAGGTGVVSVTAAGRDRVRVSAGPVSEEASVRRTGPMTISVQVINGGDLLSGVLSSFGNFSFTVPKLPGNARLTGLAVATRGLTFSFSAAHAPLSGSLSG